MVVVVVVLAVGRVTIYLELMENWGMGKVIYGK